MSQEIRVLFQQFDDGFISSDWNFNFHHESVQIPLNIIDYEHDIPSVLIAFASHEIATGSHQPLPILNFFHRESLRLKINRFIGLKLSHNDYKLIAEAVGFGSERLKIAQNFVQFGYDMNYIDDVIVDYDLIPA